MIIIVPVVKKVKTMTQCEYLSFSQGDDKFNVNDDMGAETFVVNSGKVEICVERSIVVISIATR